MRRALSLSLPLLVSLALPAAARKPAPAPAKPAPAPAKPAPAPAKPAPKAAPDPWAGRTDLFTAPPTAPTTKVELGAVTRFTLPNGLTVIAVPRKQIPSVGLVLVVKAGETAVPVDKAGLAQFTASMLRKGTKKRSSDQIAQAIDFVGGSLDASADDDASAVSCHVRTRDLALCLDLVSDVVLNPTFPEGEMGEVRDQLKASVEGAKDNPQSLAALHAANLYFGDDDPRGRPLSLKSLAAIDRASLVAFHGARYAPNNAVLALSGDFDDKTLKAQLTKFFGGWKKREVPAVAERALPPAPAGGKLKVRLVDKPDATQSSVVIVGPGVAHRDPDYYATMLMNYTLGAGAFSSRLMQVVRSEGGKTYGASSSFDAGRDAGTFTANTFTRNSETVATIKLLLDEIARMQKSGPTADELAAAKGHVIGGYGLRLETGADVARALVGAEIDQLDPEYVVKYPSRMEAVAPADAAAAAAKHLHPEALVVVGKASEVKPMLEKAGMPPVEVVAYTDPVSKAEREAQVAARGAAASASPEEAKAAKELLAAAIAARGGAAYRGVKDLQVEGKGTVTAQGRTMPFSFRGFYLRGKSPAMREDLELGPNMTLSQVLPPDGKPFGKQAGRVMDLPPPMAEDVVRSAFRDPNFVLLHAERPDVKLRGRRGVTEGGKKWDVLTVVPPEGAPIDLWLDPATHLLARMTSGAEGQTTVDELSDYKPEAGVQIPRKLVHRGANDTEEMAIEAAKVNAGLPKDTFAR